MVKVVYEGTPLDLKDGEPLLDGLLALNVDVPYGCRAGTCQSCLLKCTEGSIPEAAQKGLRPAQKLNRLILSCQCHPTEGMTLTRPESTTVRIETKVHDLKRLNADVVELSLRPDRAIAYRAGQFMRLHHPEGRFRCYSLASVPDLDDTLIFHVRAYPGGLVSQWVHHGLQRGDPVLVSEALGECVYIEGRPDQPLLLIGTGTGLAPLYGIVRDALHRGHRAPMHLYHGGRSSKDLYLNQALAELSRAYPAFYYHPCLSASTADGLLGVSEGRASDLALRAHPDLKGWGVYLCGNPEMVQATQMQAFLAGASFEEIHADPFVESRPAMPSDAGP